MDDIDSKLKTKVPNHLITSLATNDVPVWNGTTWVRPSGTASASTYLRGDGSWATIAVDSNPDPATSLPGSPADGDRAIYTNNTASPAYAWEFQYDTTIGDSYKWHFIGGSPITNYGTMSNTTNGYTTIASTTAPLTGYYVVQAGVYASNGAAGPDPLVAINNGGSVPLTVTNGGSNNRNLGYHGIHLLTGGQANFVQARANGSDLTVAHGYVTLVPIRVS